MLHNMGKKERYVRLVIGLVMVTYELLNGAYGNFPRHFALALLGFGVFTTGLLSFCPLNALVHHNSCHTCKSGSRGGHNPV